ncbi:hypothetical protein C8Q77DRAFT_1144130 [Trametes polyzona]|nr:hypothetical protein C8Q77DRAFT_1144130 [Trametes polyzona]
MRNERKKKPSVVEGKSMLAPLAERQAIAEQLRSHKHILVLLQDALEKQSWPDTDKTDDQLPKEGYKSGADPKTPPKASQVVAPASAIPPRRTSSLKRASGEMEQPAVQAPPKRSKPNLRRSARLATRKST